MGLFSKWGQKLWLDARLSSTPAAQKLLVPLLYHAKNVAQPWLKPLVNVYQWRGKTQAGELQIAFFAGEENRLLTQRVFIEPPAQVMKEQLPRGQVNKLLQETDNDMTVVQGDKSLIDSLPRQCSLRLPVFLEWLINVKGSHEEFKRRIPSNMRREAERLIRKHGYTFEASRRLEDFDDFYHNLYVPSMCSTHGELAYPTPYAEARRYFRQGWLHKIIQQDRFVGGCLAYGLSDQLHVKLMGVRNADRRLRREGVYYAVYYPMLLDANRQGFHCANFGRTSSFANLNFFQYKRRWGMSIRTVPYENSQMWIGLHRVTPAVTQFLVDNPLVCLDENKELYGLLVVNEPDELDERDLKKLEHLYFIDGMRALRIYKAADLVDGSESEGEAAPAIEFTHGGLAAQFL